jgi:hypothetical protein
MARPQKPNPPTSPVAENPEEAYRRQVIGLARALVEGRIDDIVPHLAKGHTADQVMLFVDGNYEKRGDLLTRLLEEMPNEVEGFEELVTDFINEIPVYATDTPSDEVDRFLRWILETQELSDEDRDTVTCNKARFGLERLARLKRREHLAFQKLMRSSGERRPLLDIDSTLRVHFNPICIRTRLLTKKYLEGDEPPAEVLFYAAGPGNRTSVLEKESLPSVEALSELESCTIDEWAEQVHPTERAELVELAAGLLDAGILALGAGE